jgi:DNA polymerase-3 subunit beta
MKFSCQQRDILRALTISQKAVGATGVLPILENILLEANGQKVEVLATNLEISISTTFAAKVKNEGKTTIPAKTIVSWVSLVGEGDVEVEKSEGENISFKTKGSKTNIKGISADEFPAIPVVEREDAAVVKISDFKQALHQVVFAAASGGTRPVLSGVLMNATDEGLVLVGTDSYRLSERVVSWAKPAKGRFSCIVPAKTLQAIERILPLVDDSAKEIEVVFSKNQIMFLFEGVQITSRLIDGQFPNYQQILPKAHKNEIEVDRKELIQVVKRVGIFARENSNNIKLSVKGDEMHITTDATEIGTEDAAVAIKNSGEENLVSLNAQFLLDILLVLNGDKVTLRIGEKLAPVSVSSSRSDGFLHIIMPLKS